MYDPPGLSQNYGSPYTEFAQMEAPHPTPEAAATAASAAKTTTASPPPAPTLQKETGQDVALKKKWCIDNIGPNFFNDGGVPKSALDQFTTFVNTLCP